MSKKISIYTLVLFILGIVCGIFFPSIFPAINFIGDIYINLLKIMIVPVLFSSVALALAEGNNKVTSKITLKTIILFIIMFLVSFVINSGFVALVQPGTAFNFTQTEWTGTTVSTTVKDFVLKIFSDNIIASMSTNSILPTILFAAVFGLVLNKVNAEKTIAVLSELVKVFNTMLRIIMYITPVAVFVLMGNTVALFGKSILLSAFSYVAMAWAGCAIIALLVMILPVWICAGINPITYIKKVYPIWLITLSTCSSAATLPNTIRVCNEEFNVPEKITNIVVPLGCTIHMCGGAVSFSLLALFNMQMFGIKMTPMLFITMLFCALLINMGAPGIPGGGIVIGASYLSILGIPLDFIGFYAGIYRLLDMPYTTMNVCGDITANILVDRYSNETTE